MVPAVEQTRRHHIERLKILVYETEDPLEVGEHRPGELVHQECTIGMQDRVGLVQDEVTHLGWHRRIRDARDDVVGVTQLEVGQGGVRIDG